MRAPSPDPAEKTRNSAKFFVGRLDICVSDAILDDVLRFVTSNGRRRGLILRRGSGSSVKKNEKIFVLRLAKAGNGVIL